MSIFLKESRMDWLAISHEICHSRAGRLVLEFLDSAPFLNQVLPVLQYILDLFRFHVERTLAKFPTSRLESAGRVDVD